MDNSSVWTTDFSPAYYEDLFNGSRRVDEGLLRELSPASTP